MVSGNICACYLYIRGQLTNCALTCSASIVNTSNRASVGVKRSGSVGGAGATCKRTQCLDVLQFFDPTR